MSGCVGVCVCARASVHPRVCLSVPPWAHLHTRDTSWRQRQAVREVDTPWAGGLQPEDLGSDPRPSTPHCRPPSALKVAGSGELHLGCGRDRQVHPL